MTSTDKNCGTRCFELHAKDFRGCKTITLSAFTVCCVFTTLAIIFMLTYQNTQQAGQGLNSSALSIALGFFVFAVFGGVTALVLVMARIGATFCSHPKTKHKDEKGELVIFGANIIYSFIASVSCGIISLVLLIVEAQLVPSSGETSYLYISIVFTIVSLASLGVAVVLIAYNGADEVSREYL